jgi:ADP-heptose:LPS heptosyltransferase
MSALGDVAMTVPVITTCLHRYPELQITVLSRPFMKPLFKDLDRVRFVGADVKGEHKGLVGLYRLYKTLRCQDFDAVLDMHDVLRSMVLRFFFRLSGARVLRIHKGRKGKKALTRPRNKVFKPLKTTHERYADLFRKLGFETDLSNPVLPHIPVPKEDLSQQLGDKKESWLGIAPFAQHASKMYPLNLMEEVIRRIIESGNVRIFLFGGGALEVEQLNSLAKKFEGTTCVAGAYRFEEELQIIGMLDAMVSMDSGNGHLAAMYGLPVITIWGVTHPYAGFAPFLQSEQQWLMPDREEYPEIPCSVYGNTFSPGYEQAIASLDPEHIAATVIRVIKKDRKP